MKCNAKIERVEKGSIAEKYGLSKNDIILSVNDFDVRDSLDWIFRTCAEKIKIKALRNEKIFEINLKKQEEEPLGIVFDGVIFDSVKTCKNKCVFCFVDQEYDGARKTMKIKDDDFRLSFFWGNFISLTNLKEEDYKKIEEYFISPLYVSVHATNPELRKDIFKNKFAGDIINQLKKLINMNITVHTQIVLCPCLNDGRELLRTLEDLSDLYPAVASIAIVPVGLTKYHKNGLRAFTVEEMKKIIKDVSKFQKGEPFIFLSDEFYIKTNTLLPSNKAYGEYPQIENGIGMMRSFLTDFNRNKRFIPDSVPKKREISIITGVLAGTYLEKITESFKKVKNLSLKVHVAKNYFWGGNVDVAGLLTGFDVEKTLKAKQYYRKVLISSNCLTDDFYFLDGKNIKDLEKTLNCDIIPVEPDFKSFKNAILKDNV